MKKILSLLLTFTLLLSLSAIFSSCSHECEFSSEWQKDDVAHWHACTAKEGCTEVSEKADHTYGEGVITTKPTPDADGAKTFTCTVCAYTKTETIPKCVLSADFKKDETSHWHTCTNEGCPEIYEKADHTWDEGEITTKPTQDADGVKTFTCTACAATKTEPVVFTGMSRAEWTAALSTSAFENFSYVEKATISATGFSMEVEEHYKFTADDAWIKVVMAGTSEETYAPDTESAIEARISLLESLKAIASYSAYEYDAKTKTYQANRQIYIAAYSASTSDVSLTFEGDRLTEIHYSISVVENGIPLLVTASVIISDYGTVVLPIPEGPSSGGSSEL